MEIGEKIRRLCIPNNPTQEELADCAELSKGFIFQLKCDLTFPSITTPMDILQCPSTMPADFFNEEAPEQLVFRKVDYFEKQDSELKNHICWLIPNTQKNMMEPMPLTLEPGDRMAEDAPHVGEEFGYVLSGSLKLHLGNEARRVKKGESFYYRSEKNHYVSSRTGCTLLHVSTPPSFWIEREDHKFMSALVDLQHISKSFDGETVLGDLNLTVPENSLVTLLGPPGCSKTTALRIPGGFTMPDNGKVMFDGQDIASLPPNRHQLDTMFQKYTLSLHMSIAENIAFGLKIKGKSEAYIDDKIRYALKLVDLSGFEKRDVNSFSGGQQQRIAIARAIVNEPRLLSLDEPPGAPDLKLRQDMQYELIRLKKEPGIIFVYVTHDQEETLTMSDTIVVMDQGYIQQMGTSEQIYSEPENVFVADFVGDSNIIGATMAHDELINIFGVNFRCVDKGFGQNKPVDVVIRPEDVELVKPGDGTLTGHVTHSIFKGVHYEMEVTTENGYEWLVQSTRMFELGQAVSIMVDPFNIQITNKSAPEGEEVIVNE